MVEFLKPYICTVQQLLLIVAGFLLMANTSIGQPDTTKPYLPHYPTTIKKGRAWALGASTVALAAGGIFGLNEAWYANAPRSSFHFFDDSQEWLSMDKTGHFFTCYTVGYYYHDLMRNCGINPTMSTFLGGSMGAVFMFGIEVLDGFSQDWGFSMSDFGINSLGSAVFIGQQLLWKEQRIIPKISWHDSGLSFYRPQLLGSNFSERLLKDYNGHTLWLSVNIHAFIKNPPRHFPRWLSVSVGYGAQGLIGGVVNPTLDQQGNPIPEFARYRQFYLSLDVDLSRIKTRKQWVRSLCKVFTFIKLPFPTIEINTLGRAKFHPIYF